jgi:hypothetical protein
MPCDAPILLCLRPNVRWAGNRAGSAVASTRRAAAGDDASADAQLSGGGPALARHPEGVLRRGSERLPAVSESSTAALVRNPVIW